MGDPSAAVLFDVDGTLLDTNYLHAVAWTRALRETGHDPEMAEVHGAIGIASNGLVEKLTGGSDEDAVEAQAKAYEEFKDDIRAFPKAAELLRACRERGLAVVLATSGGEKDLDWMLPAIGLEDDELTGATTSSDVEASKPEPDLLQVSIDKHGLDAAHTVVVGDTVWDVEAARRAGLACIALTCGGIAEAVLREAGASEVYADPADLLARLDDSLIGSLPGKDA